MKRHQQKDYARPGTRRAARLLAEAQCRAALLQRMVRLRKTAPVAREKDHTGCAYMYVPGEEPEDVGQGGHRNPAAYPGLRTPHGARSLRRRRAASKVARRSRRNRT